jgi:hypothetical protein
MQIPAIGIIKPEYEDEIINSDKKIYTTDIFQKVIIDKKLVQKVVEKITIDNEQVEVTLINGNMFLIKR